VRSRHVVIVAAIVAAFSCVSFLCGSGVTFWAMPHIKSKSPVGKGNDEKPLAENANPDNTALTDKWTWQGLQDHLANKGMKTSRGAAAGGMWFVQDEFRGEIAEGGWVDKSNGRPLAGWEINNLGDMKKDIGFPDEGVFLVNDLSSPDAAKKGAAEFKDVLQRNVLAWDRFIFQGNQKTLNKLKTLLP
jgi:hypothetical protein